MSRHARGTVFIAAPLTKTEHLRFNEEIAAVLEPFMDVFLPQRDAGLVADMQAAGVSLAAAGAVVLRDDLAGLRASDMLLAVLDAPRISGGVAFEVGVAHALGIPCVALQSPQRREFGGDDSPLLSAVFEHRLADIDELRDWLKRRHAMLDAPQSYR